MDKILGHLDSKIFVWINHLCEMVNYYANTTREERCMNMREDEQEWLLRTITIGIDRMSIHEAFD